MSAGQFLVSLSVVLVLVLCFVLWLARPGAGECRRGQDEQA